MFDSRVAGDSVTVVKSRYYFKKKDVHLDRIVFKVENDAAAATAALKAGDLQALDTISPSNLPFVRSDSSLRLFHQTQFGFQAITFNIGNKNGVGKLPYQNVGTPLATSRSLRKAFDEAIDRKATGRVVLDGLMIPGCTAVSPVSAWFDATVACPRYDPADARKLVQASGMRNPTVHLLTSNLTDDVRLAQAIQAQEGAIGINVVIDSGDKATVQARAAAGDFDAFLGPAWTGSFNADGNIYKFVATSGSRNWSGYSNPHLDRLLDEARQAPTMTAAKVLYHRAETIVLDDRPVIYLYHAIKYAGASRRVTGVQFDPGLSLRVAFAQLK
jgi:peptide/nickel transport system substrate-binding protein